MRDCLLYIDFAYCLDEEIGLKGVYINKQWCSNYKNEHMAARKV